MIVNNFIYNQRVTIAISHRCADDDADDLSINRNMYKKTTIK